MIDPKTGKKIAGRLTKLRLGELSFVDVGADPNAKVAIAKRGEKPKGAPVAAAVAKLLKAYAVGMVDDGAAQGAKTFDELLAETQAREQQWEAYRELSPLFDALTSSIQSIAADQSKGVDAQIELVRQSVESFMNAIAGSLPDVQQELQKLCKEDPAIAGLCAGKAGDPGEGDGDMAGNSSEIDTLKSSIADLTTKLEKAYSDLKVAMKHADDNAAEVAKLKAEAEVAKSDEVAEFEGETVRKSVVGEQMFNILRKSHDRAELADFTKRAETEIRDLPGDVVVKAKALRAVSRIKDKDEREAVETMLKAGSAALRDGMKPRGRDNDGSGGAGEGGSSSGSSALQKRLDVLIAKQIEADPKLSKAAAMSKALETEEGKDIYEEMNDAE